MRSPLRTTHGASPGFTLVELLVVIAVIGVLASLLLPALGKGVGQVKTTRCISNLKQWAAAAYLFQEDNDGYLPRESFHPSGVIINTWAEVRSVTAEDVWYNALAKYIKSPPASDFAPKAAHDDFYRRETIFHCPVARFPKGAGSAGQQLAFFSLAMNSKLLLPGMKSLRWDAITKPSSTVLFIDARVDDSEPMADPLQSTIFLGQPSAYASRFAPRHNQRGNIAFVDGRVEGHSGSKVVYNGGAIVPQTEIIWTANPEANPN